MSAMLLCPLGCAPWCCDVGCSILQMYKFFGKYNLLRPLFTYVSITFSCLDALYLFFFATFTPLNGVGHVPRNILYYRL